jgi:hypothetical protein
MKLTPPKKTTFYISLVLALLGLIGYFITIPVVSGIAFFLVLAGYIVLVLGLLLKGF